MPVHGAHSAHIPGAWDDLVDALGAMLAEDPDQENATFWQVENDGSIWPRLDELQRRTGRSNVYHSFRVAAMVAAGMLPENYTDG